MSELVSKIQKITKALYRLTETLPNDEPLRARMRKIGLEIFERVIFLESIEKSEFQREVEEIKRKIQLLENYFSLINDFKLSENLSLLDSLSRAYKRLDSYLTIVLKKKNSLAERKNRIKKILSLLKKKEKVRVKDILKALPGVSERTIQRDINFLLKQGLIEKIGDKKATGYVVKMS